MAIAATKPLDLVLMDISMPGMSGIEVARILRERERTADVLIAIHTGLDEHWVRERFSDYDLFLTKATDTDVLVQRIAKLFAEPTATRARRVTALAPQRYSTDDLINAREALRKALGLGSEIFEKQNFIEKLGDEISQLRRVGRTDADIAVLIGKAIERDFPTALLEGGR